MDRSVLEELSEYPLDRSYPIEEFIEDISRKIYREFEDYKDYHPAILGEESGQKLYDLVRQVEPEIVVETGVCNGFSSSIILKAMKENGKGELYSVDLPVNLDELESTDRTGAVLPPGKRSGWAVPDRLIERWTLREGNTYHELPKVFEGLSDKIDIFLHDSDHSYETMMFEFSLAWRNLKERGFLLADNIDYNEAFFDFTVAKALEKYNLGNMGLMIKNPKTD